MALNSVFKTKVSNLSYKFRFTEIFSFNLLRKGSKILQNIVKIILSGAFVFLKRYDIYIRFKLGG